MIGRWEWMRKDFGVLKREGERERELQPGGKVEFLK